MRGRAQLKLKDGTIAFECESKTFGVVNMIDDLKKKITHEFDYCFEADAWATVEIRIDRD